MGWIHRVPTARHDGNEDADSPNKFAEAVPRSTGMYASKGTSTWSTCSPAAIGESTEGLSNATDAESQEHSIQASSPSRLVSWLPRRNQIAPTLDDHVHVTSAISDLRDDLYKRVPCGLTVKRLASQRKHISTSWYDHFRDLVELCNMEVEVLKQACPKHCTKGSAEPLPIEDLAWVKSVAGRLNIDISSMQLYCSGQLHNLLASIIRMLADKLQKPQALEAVDMADWHMHVCEVLQAYYGSALEGTPYLPEDEPEEMELANEYALAHHWQAVSGDQGGGAVHAHACKQQLAVGPHLLAGVALHAYRVSKAKPGMYVGATATEKGADGKARMQRDQFGEALLEAVLTTGVRQLASRLLARPGPVAAHPPTSSPPYFAELTRLKPTHVLDMIVKLWYAHVPQGDSAGSSKNGPPSPKKTTSPCTSMQRSGSLTLQNATDLALGDSGASSVSGTPRVAPWLEYKEAEAPAKDIVLRVLDAYCLQCQRESLPFILRIDLEWKKIVDLLIHRAAACKPFACAMIEWVEGSVEVLKSELMVRQQVAAAEAAERATATATATGTEDDHSSEAGEGLLNARSLKEFKSRTERWRQFAVQAAKLSVYTQSTKVMNSAVGMLRTVHATDGGVDLVLLYLLSKKAPFECAELLSTIPLVPLSLDDPVLPFNLPRGFSAVTASQKDGEEFAHEDGGGGMQDDKFFTDQDEEDATIDASLLGFSTTWLAYFLAFLGEDYTTPTARRMSAIVLWTWTAFILQGPGSFCVGIILAAVVLTLGIAMRIVMQVVCIILYCFDLVMLKNLARIQSIMAAKEDSGNGDRNGSGKKGDALGGVWNLLNKEGVRDEQLLMMQDAPKPIPTPVVLAKNGKGTKSAFGLLGSTVLGAGSLVKNAVGTAAHGVVSGVEGMASSASTAVGNASTRGSSLAASSSVATSFNIEAAKQNALEAAKKEALDMISSGHKRLINKLLGWGEGSAVISCKKVPVPLLVNTSETGGHSLDMRLLQNLLDAKDVHPTVYGTSVLRAIILFRWSYFTRFFILLQFFLHMAFMGIFLAYAFSIRLSDTIVVDAGGGDARDSGPGSDVANCMLPEPTKYQIGLLSVLAVLAVDFLSQEIRQVRHFGMGRYVSQPWNVLDVASAGLLTTSIILNLTCMGGATPNMLRGLAGMQILLLFIRLMYYAMANDKLGSFVRMVLETINDLSLFFVFMAVVFVGFSLALLIMQGDAMNERGMFLRFFCLIWGDFGFDFIQDIEAGSDSVSDVARVLYALYMILVTIVLLNLLIAIINESYQRIRENEMWESLRNKATLIVEMDTLLYDWLRPKIFHAITEPLTKEYAKPADQPKSTNNKRWLYVILPERAQSKADEDEDDFFYADEADEGAEWAEEKTMSDTMLLGNRVRTLKRKMLQGMGRLEDTIKQAVQCQPAQHARPTHQPPMHALHDIDMPSSTTAAAAAAQPVNMASSAMKAAISTSSAGATAGMHDGADVSDHGIAEGATLAAAATGAGAAGGLHAWEHSQGLSAEHSGMDIVAAPAALPHSVTE